MRTISDHPLLVGEILERANARDRRRKQRAERLQPVLHWASKLAVTVLAGLMLYLAVVMLYFTGQRLGLWNP